MSIISAPEFFNQSLPFSQISIISFDIPSRKNSFGIPTFNPLILLPIAFSKSGISFDELVVSLVS